MVPVMRVSTPIAGHPGRRVAALTYQRRRETAGEKSFSSITV